MVRRLSCIVLTVCLAGGTTAAQTTLVADVRAAIGRNDLGAADALVATFRQARGTTPEALEALSWLGRGALAAGDNATAIRYSQEARQLVVASLASRRLDSDSHLPVALGAAIETEAKAMAAMNQRASALIFLRTQLDAYRSTAIRARIQKNIHLLGLEGQPAPPLTASEHLGAPMPATTGRPVLLFFWAHWCPDCKAQAPIVADLQASYGPQGLVVVAPTRRYGYAAAGVDVAPAEELKYIDGIRQQYYGTIKDMAVPVSDEDALGYGMDATPTLVLVDRQGKVALYHPGRMTRQELEPYLRMLVASPPNR